MCQADLSTGFGQRAGYGCLFGYALRQGRAVRSCSGGKDTNMIRRFVGFAASIHRQLRKRAPTNRLIDLLRTRRGLKWAVPVAVVLVPAYLCVAHSLSDAVDLSASGWLNLLVLLLCWNALKFAAMAAFSVLRLCKAWANGWRERSEARREGYLPGRDLGPWTTIV